MLALDVAALSNAELQGRKLAAFQKLVLWVLRDARAPARLLANFEAWSGVMAEAGRTRSGQDALWVLLEYMFRVVDPVYWDLLRAKLHLLDPHAEEAAMTIAEMLHEEGRAKGHEEGRIATLRGLLIFRFEALDAATEARLRSATPEAIERYLRRLLTADSLAAVFED
jgi:hypothetical protein